MQNTGSTTETVSTSEMRALLESLRNELVGVIDAKLHGSASPSRGGSKAACELESDLMTQHEVCRFLRLTKPTVIDYEKRGFLRVLRIGRRVYYRRSDIMRTMESGITKGKAQQ